MNALITVICLFPGGRGESIKLMYMKARGMDIIIIIYHIILKPNQKHIFIPLMLLFHIWGNHGIIYEFNGTIDN